jgi:hypothetical protein
MNIPIYDSEQNLSTELQNNIVQASCQILSRKSHLDINKLSLASEHDKDLYHLYTIMVSAGINKNDDVFTKKELWEARDTPVDKPLNIEHSPRIIIGHITQSSMIDDQYQAVSEYEDNEDENDEIYHLLTGGVIYKHINSIDKDLEKECSKIIEEIDNGEWYVSMECLFTDFDYALIHPVFGKRFIGRNDSTSFLTKYLKIYGGEGYYNGMKIGRVLKGLLFSGKGLVKNPANPNSIILNNVHSFGGAYASLEDLQLINKQGELNMANDFEAKYNDSQNEIKDLRERLVKAGEEQHKNDLKIKDEEISQLNTEIASLKEKITELTTQFNEVSKVKETLEVAKAGIEKELNDKTTEIATIQAEKIKIDRVSILVSAGVEKSEAEKLTERFSGVSDEQFSEIVELQKKIIVSASVVADENADEVVEDSTVEDATVDEEVLDNVEVEDSTALASETSEEDEDKAFISTFASWADSIFQTKDS